MREAGQIERLSIRSDPGRIRDARRWISEIVGRGGWEASDARDLALALSEACSNAHRYAYGGRKDGRIDVRLELWPSRIEIAVRDYGVGFDASSYRGPDLSRPREGGYGIHLMKQLTDHVEHRAKEAGTLVVMIKTRRPEAQAGARGAI